MKKILSLFVLLVAIVTGAKADPTYKGNFTDQQVLTLTTSNYGNASSGYIKEGWMSYVGPSTGSATLKINPETDEAISGTSATYGKIKQENSRYMEFYVTGVTAVKFYFANTGSDDRTVKVSVNGGDASDLVTVVQKTSNSASVTSLNASANNTIKLWATGDTYVCALKVTVQTATEAFTVSFNAGTNGTCATTSITEESAGAGVTLPTATPNSGYTFDGWYNGETKVGDAGETYHPTAAVTLTAKYSALTAPTISVDNTSVSTYKSVAVTFTATADGAPDPTVTWYQNASASTTGGTSVGTGLTYQPDVTAEGTYYYYAVASNGVEPDATSEVVTLTVTDPDKYVTGNAYYISNGETAVKGEKIFADDITMTFVANGGFNAAATDDKVSSVNSNYVASIAGDNNSNSWGPEFVATKDGSLSVGVIINKNKTFTITNVSSFTYKGKNGADEDVDETVDGNSITTANNDNAKLYVVATIDVVAGKTYKFSVAGSKMGFYGFVFVPEGATETITTDNGVATYVTKQALDFTGLETKAYVVTGVNEAKTSVATAEVTTVPAGTALLVKGATVEVPVIANATAPATNLFKISTGDGVQGADNIFAYSKSAKQFKKVSSSIKVPAGKCYLQIDGVSGDALDLDFDGEATAVDAIAEAGEAKAAPVKVIKNGKLYIGNFNLAGQQVK